MSNVALVANTKGKPLDVLNLVESKPKSSQNVHDGNLQVKVISAGLAFPDLLMIEDKHVFKMKYPAVVGRECAGVITAIGKGVDSKRFKIGDTVFGATHPEGAIQTETEIPADNAYLIPQGVSPHVLSGFEVNYGTTWHGLVHIANLKRGEFLLVLGASGGVGVSACDIGRALGARVIACASSKEKLQSCLDAGAEFAVDYSNMENFRTEVEKITGKSTQGGGVHVVYDAVGGAHSEVALKMLGFGGRFLVIGFASGGNNPPSAIPKIPLNLMLLNERKVMGVLYGAWKALNPDENRAMVDTMLELIRIGKLRPMHKVYPIKNWRLAFEDMIHRRSVGKITISLQDESLSKL